MTIMQTASGRYLDLTNFTPSDFNALDIASSLSKLCRYCGHCRMFYSVAEHSVMVAEILKQQGHTPAVQLLGLFHDAHEAYTGDMLSPLKRFDWSSAGGMEFGALQQEIQEAIEEAVLPDGIDLEPSAIEVVHQADLVALATERAYLMDMSPNVDAGTCWQVLENVLPMPIQIWGRWPANAEQNFLWEYERLLAELNHG
jgi:hypothetical protein